MTRDWDENHDYHRVEISLEAKRPISGLFRLRLDEYERTSFTHTWCRGKKKFESETICLDCHMWSWRSYFDPDFLTPEESDKLRWEKMVKENEKDRIAARALKSTPANEEEKN